MTRNEVKDKLLEIMEFVDDAHVECGECLFYDVLGDFCPFNKFVQAWEIIVYTAHAISALKIQ